jgi:hypothetical protein
MIDPGSVGDWLQASLMAGALSALAAAGRWALRLEEAERGRSAWMGSVGRAMVVSLSKGPDSLR